MPSPNATPTPITPPRVPLIDPRTGLIDRAWYLFFLSLNNVATGVIDDSGLTFNSESIIASYDAALLSVNQELQTLPPTVDLSAELIKQIQEANLVDCCSALMSQTAEMQKQIEALNVLPPPSLGTIVAVTATAPVVSSGGISPDISMPAANTTTDGYLTSTDWNTFNNKQPAGTYVTAISIASSNGLAGTSSGGATPALTLSTSITGILKGNGTAISAAVANTDYMGVGAPVTKTADFTVADGDIWYINNKSGSTCTVTLPAASSWTGRTLTFKNMQAQTLVSASSNVVPIDSTSAGTAILLAVVGNWATMVSDGTNWIIMQQAANNCLLLE
jgi:hypothetical protein